MPDWTGAGKAIIWLGVLLVLIGALVTVVGRLSGAGNGLGWLGKLPGDILVRRESFSMYIPFTSSILVSILLSLLLGLFSWLKR